MAHLFLHWKWIVAMGRSFGKLPDGARFKCALNLLTLGAFWVTLGSGLMLLWTSSNSHSAFHWHVIHHAGVLLMLMTVAVHLVLHRQWIAGAIKRRAAGPLPPKGIAS